MDPNTTLVTCGCSFTQQDGWAKHVKQTLGYERLLNFAVGGGTNNTQINRFNDFLLSNDRPFDMIWQITYPSRTSNLRLPPDHPDVVSKKFLPRRDRGFTYAQVSPQVNYIDGRRHVDILYDDYVLRRHDAFYSDVNNDLSQLLCTVFLASKLAQRLLIFFGVDNIESQQVDAMERFFLEKDIPFVAYQKNMFEYVKHNNLPLAEDGWHPAQESYVDYAEKILLPTLVDRWKL